MTKKGLKVLMGAFNVSGKCISYFDLIEDVENMKAGELDIAMEQAFLIYIQYEYYAKTDITLICKYMFVYPEEEDITYSKWGDKDTILPYSHKVMSNIFEYDFSGGIKEIYD